MKLTSSVLGNPYVSGNVCYSVILNSYLFCFFFQEEYFPSIIYDRFECLTLLEARHISILGCSRYRFKLYRLFHL